MRDLIYRFHWLHWPWRYPCYNSNYLCWPSVLLFSVCVCHSVCFRLWLPGVCLRLAGALCLSVTSCLPIFVCNCLVFVYDCLLSVGECLVFVCRDSPVFVCDCLVLVCDYPSLPVTAGACACLLFICVFLCCLVLNICQYLSGTCQVFVCDCLLSVNA